jgi:PAS domain-containing protein
MRNRLLSWRILGVDVDKQFKAQEALKASEQEAREILDRVPAMISIRTEEGVVRNQRISLRRLALWSPRFRMV